MKNWRETAESRSFAPVGIFGYRRPRHLERTLEALIECPQFASSPKFVFCDGAKTAAENEAVEQTRSRARKMLGDSAEYRFHSDHQGLANSIIDGVGELCSRFGSAIVVEDDLVVAPNFLEYMNQGLDKYAECSNVMQIAGYMYEVPELRDSAAAVVLPFTSSWGWATWKRAWDQFDPLAQGWERLREDRLLRRKFDIDGVCAYYLMLRHQMAGRCDSWAIRWYWTVFRSGGSVVFPPRSLVQNIGTDGSGTHGASRIRRFNKPLKHVPGTILLPDVIRIDASVCRAVRCAIYRQSGGIAGQVINWLRSMMEH